jgi:hypothetical protein
MCLLRADQTYDGRTYANPDEMLKIAENLLAYQPTFARFRRFRGQDGASHRFAQRQIAETASKGVSKLLVVRTFSAAHHAGAGSDRKPRDQCEDDGGRGILDRRLDTRVRFGCAPCQGGAFQWVQGPPGASLQPEATGAGMEVTKCLKPSDGGSRIGDRASVQAATRVHAEQASHDEDFGKGSHHGDIETSPLLRDPKSKLICATRPGSEHDQSHMRSPLIAAAPRSRFRRAGLRKTKTILESGISGHGLLRSVSLDPPGLIRSWEMAGLRWCLR